MGTAAAAISVVLGVMCGLIAGYRGGWVDAWMMRSVDVMYSLPYILMIVLFKVALAPRELAKKSLGDTEPTVTLDGPPVATLLPDESWS